MKVHLAQRRRKKYSDLYLPAKTMEFDVKSAALVNSDGRSRSRSATVCSLNICFIVCCLFDRDNT